MELSLNYIEEAVCHINACWEEHNSVKKKSELLKHLLQCPNYKFTRKVLVRALILLFCLL